MLVYCSSALFNKLMFWGLYWHLTAWLELMWLNSWKNTMGCLSALPKITVGEEGLINTWADLYSVVQLFQWNAHKTTFEAWGLLTLPEQAQIVWADFRAFLCVWKALVSCRVWSRGSLLELCFQERNACVCKLGSCVKPRVKPFVFLAQVSDLAVPDHSLPIKAERFLSQWNGRLLLTEVLNKIFAVILIRSFTVLPKGFCCINFSWDTD